MPKNLDEIAPTPAEDIEIASMGIALQALLNRQSQALHAAAHVRVPSGDPDPDAARYRDHRRLRTSRTRPNASASTFSSTLTRLPSPSSISIRQRRFQAGIAAGASIDRTLSAAAAATRTGTRRGPAEATDRLDRKSTRLNSSHRCISYAVFCLKKKKKMKPQQQN